MRLIFILAVISISSCAKLDLTFLLSSNERASGAAVDFFIEPEFDATGFDENSFGFVQDSTDLTENKKDLSQKPETSSQKENDIPQETNGFNQNHNPFSQNQNSDTMINLPQPDNADPQYVDNIDRSEHVEKVKNIGQNDFLNGDPKSDSAQTAFERLARILRLNTDNNGEVYSYSYKSENGLPESAQGVKNNGAGFKGGFSYTGDDGKVYSIRYEYENELGPQVDHLLASPDLYRAVRKAIAQNEQNEANGFFDDGVNYPAKYHLGKYDNSEIEAARFNNFAYGNDMFGNGNNGNGFGDSNYNFNGFNPESDETDGSFVTRRTYIPTSFDQNYDDPPLPIVTNAAHHFSSNNQRFQIKNQRLNDRKGNKRYGASDESSSLIKSVNPPFEIRMAPKNRRPNQNGNDNVDIKEDLYSINNEYLPQYENQQLFPKSQVYIKNSNQNINEYISSEEESESFNNVYFQTIEDQDFGNQRAKNINLVGKANSVLNNNRYIPPLENSALSIRNRKPNHPHGNKEDIACVKTSYLPVTNQKSASTYQRPERIHQSLDKIIVFDQEPETFLPYRDRSRGNLRFNNDGGPQVASNPGFRSYPALNFGGRRARKSNIIEIMTTTSTKKPDEYEDSYYDASEF